MKTTKKSSYFLIALCLTTCLMLFKKSNFLGSITNSNTLRNLQDQAKRRYICSEAGSRLTEKYQTDFSEEEFKKESLTEAQRSIIDFARDSTL